MLNNDTTAINEPFNFPAYMAWNWTTTTPKESDHGGWWSASGLACEAGELLALFEKSHRKNQPVDEAKLKSELGDVFWFWCSVCNMMDVDPIEIINANVAKINERLANGQITSEG